jgi:hypothetical protein
VTPHGRSVTQPDGEGEDPNWDRERPGKMQHRRVQVEWRVTLSLRGTTGRQSQATSSPISSWSGSTMTAVP